MLPVVAIIGRPNVGKSSLFNRLVGKRYAITSDISGTTRDRIYYSTHMGGYEMMLVDTGGIEIGKHEDIQEDVQSQARIALEDADVIMFIVDAQTDLTQDDFAVADILRKTDKEIILVANKCDNATIEMGAFSFAELGFGEPEMISAIHGGGVDDLVDKIVDYLEGSEFEKSDSTTGREEDGIIDISLVGRPNVGKSSLINAFLGEDRLIVSDTPGTTRDTTDTLVEYEGQEFNLIDTAGLRRRGQRNKERLERYSTIRSLQGVARSDVSLLVLDFNEGLSKQDLHVCEYILDEKKGLIIVVNKCDLMEDFDKQTNYFISMLRSRMAFVPWAPVVFVSAKRHRNIFEIFNVAKKIVSERSKKIPTGDLNDWLIKTTLKHQPPCKGTVFPKIKYVTQTGINPPEFVFFMNRPDVLHFSYKRYLENELRHEFGFVGTGVRFFWKKK